VNALRAAIVHGARRSSRRGEARRSPRPGDGLEFAQLRGYIDGDDPRRIDWAATARSGALQARVYYEETALVLAGLIDSSASMRSGVRRSLADAAADALRAWFGAADADDRPLRILGKRLVAGRGALSVAAPGESFDLHAALQFALRVVPRNASLLVVTDAFDFTDREHTLARVAGRFDATILLARDPWHAGLPLRGWQRIRDAETQAERIVRFDRAARARYLAAVAARERELSLLFTRAGWRVGSLGECDGSADLERAFGLR